MAYFLSHDYLSYINSLVFFMYFPFLSDEGPTLETLDYAIRIGGKYTNLSIFKVVFLGLSRASRVFLGVVWFSSLLKINT